MEITKAFIQDMEQQLLERKTQLEGELRQLATRSNSGGGQWQATYVDVGRSEDENASEVAMYSDNLSLKQTLETALRDVAGALARIASGTYGTCRYCGKEIDEKRIRARPTSSACVACKVERKSVPR
ncbi:TraR/DksA C4-type zinc finger protein [Candidatus Uhrbacteria bacterium]|nr:TraR/DksA C4-type zinc finger protein [Candidatus Uhrbacteria bacterium]